MGTNRRREWRPYLSEKKLCHFYHHYYIFKRYGKAFRYFGLTPEEIVAFMASHWILEKQKGRLAFCRLPPPTPTDQPFPLSTNHNQKGNEMGGTNSKLGRHFSYPGNSPNMQKNVFVKQSVKDQTDPKRLWNAEDRTCFVISRRH